MAAKGTLAKRMLFDALIEVFGTAVVCEKDNKLYLNLQENGSIVQVAVSATCPKTPITADGDAAIAQETPFEAKVEFDKLTPTDPTSEFTKDEENNIATLLDRLGF